MAQKRKTCRRYNESGHAHALTFSCFRRQKLLNGDRSRGWLTDAINAGRKKHRIHVWAYVMMPEHVHLLVWPTLPEYDISRFLQSVKTSVSRRAIAFVRREATWFLPRFLDQQPNGDRHYRFWQRGGGYDRNILKPCAAWKEIDYIHANPVRRRLCERPQDWAWSSAADYLGPREGPLTIDRESLPERPQDR